jgi:hypothetical protein
VRAVGAQRHVPRRVLKCISRLVDASLLLGRVSGSIFYSLIALIQRNLAPVSPRTSSPGLRIDAATFAAAPGHLRRCIRLTAIDAGFCFRTTTRHSFITIAVRNLLVENYWSQAREWFPRLNIAGFETVRRTCAQAHSPWHVSLLKSRFGRGIGLPMKTLADEF